jgi:DNA-binding MurR/RpiR family transcriptional regulator
MIELAPVETPMKYIVSTAATLSDEISSLGVLRRRYFDHCRRLDYHAAMPPPSVRADADLRQQISAKLPYLSPALRQLGEYILAAPDAPQSMTISELASAAGVADSTVSRFTSKLGLDGYHALKLGMAEAEFARRAHNGARAEGFVYENVTRGDPVGTIVTKLSNSSRHALGESARQLDVDALEAAVSLVERARTIVLASMGSSSIAAENAIGRFTRAGKKCLFERDQALQVMSATTVDADDLVIGISDSGHTTLVIEALRLAKARGAPTIAITSDSQAPLVAHADVTLFTATVPSAGGIYGETVTSKWGQLLVVDALYAAFAARNFDETIEHLQKTYSTVIAQSRS